MADGGLAADGNQRSSAAASRWTQDEQNDRGARHLQIGRYCDALLGLGKACLWVLCDLAVGGLRLKCRYRDPGLWPQEEGVVLDLRCLGRAVQAYSACSF